jgi:hypothetical protein
VLVHPGGRGAAGPGVGLQAGREPEGGARAELVHVRGPGVGLGFFQNRVLLLDLPRARFAILDADALRGWVEEQAAWVAAEHRHGKLFVPLQLGDSTYRAFFYDSGASLFPVTTTPEIWRAITGRAGDEADNLVWRVPSFGEMVEMVGAPARVSAAVGSARISTPTAFYRRSGPERLDFRTWDFPVEGLFGNAIFEDRYVVIVDLPRQRFGLLESDRVP